MPDAERANVQPQTIGGLTGCLPTGGPGPYRRFEVLYEPADLATWAERSRLTPTPALEISETEVAEARRLRGALFRVAIAHTRDEPPPPDDLATVNEAAARPALAPAIAPSGQRRWAGAPNGTHLLATVARDAVELLTGPFVHRIRTCAGENCRLVYVDTSRPGRRRWCSMEHCGNRHKVRAMRARQSKTERDGLDEIIDVAEAEHGPISEKEIHARRDQLRRARQEQSL